MRRSRRLPFTDCRRFQLAATTRQNKKVKKVAFWWAGAYVIFYVQQVLWIEATDSIHAILQRKHD